MIALNSVIVVNVELLSFNHYSPINKNKSKKKMMIFLDSPVHLYVFDNQEQHTQFQLTGLNWSKENF